MTALTFTLSSEDKAEIRELVQHAMKEELRDALQQMQMETTLPEIMTRTQLRKHLHVSEYTISQLINHRPGFPVSHEIGEASPRFHREAIINWMFPKEEALREQRKREFKLDEWDERSRAQ